VHAFAPYRGGFVAVSRSIQPARAAAAAALAAAALLAAACSTGQTAQTSTEKSTVEGAHANLGNIALRNVRVAYPDGGRYPAGSSAPLQFIVVNEGGTADSLVSVRADVAPSVALAPAGASGSATPGGSGATGSATATASATATPSATASPSASVSGTLTPSVPASATAPAGGSGTSSATASASPTSTGSAAQPSPVQIPGGALVSFEQGAATAELTGLTRDLQSGQLVMVTFTFAEAGSVTIAVPVATPENEVEKPSLTPTASGSG
jgi:copper(I)-binding protein